MGESFVNIVQHLSSSGTDLGIEMIAANYGIGGTGLGFWDSSAPAGIRSWACFRFHSASSGKFDCFILSVTGNTGIAYGSNIVTTDQQTNNAGGADTQYRQLLISFAVHPSGSNVTQSDGPWNGTYSLTSASIGNPVWKVNSAGKGAFFPRQNGISGINSGSRGCMLSVTANSTPNTAGLGRKLHIIASEDSLAIMQDNNNNGNCTVTYFGPYTPRSGTIVDAPYLCWSSTSDSIPGVPFDISAVGSTGNSNNTNTTQGGMCHPDLASGSRSFILGGFTGWLDINYGYNRFLNGGTYEKFPFTAILSEAPTDYAVMGVVNHVYNGTGMAYYSVSSLSSSCAWGTSDPAVRKFLTPWSGSAPTTTPAIAQAGINWGLDL